MAGESAREVARKKRDKAERLLRDAERWERGAEGESTTATVLDGLPSGWTVLHDVRWPGRPRANIDHVVIGPAGVFVVDTKNWSGSVAVRDGVLRQDGRQRESVVASAAEAALAVASRTTALTVHQVHPVLCIRRDEPLDGWARDVMVTSSSTLLPMLLSRPTVVHPTRVAQVVRDLRRALPRAVDSTQPEVRPVAMATSRSPRRAPARRKRGARRELGRLGAGLVLLAALALGGPYLPALVAPIAHQITDRLVVEQPARTDPPPTDTAGQEPAKDRTQVGKKRAEKRTTEPSQQR